MERGKWHALVQQLKLDPLAFSWLHLWWTGLESLKLILIVTYESDSSLS